MPPEVIAQSPWLGLAAALGGLVWNYLKPWLEARMKPVTPPGPVNPVPAPPIQPGPMPVVPVPDMTDRPILNLLLKFLFGKLTQEEKEGIQALAQQVKDQETK